MPIGESVETIAVCLPTAPQRDERLGWLGDRTTGAYGESFIFGNALMYKKWLVDIEESMNENGSISVVSPRYLDHLP